MTEPENVFADLNAPSETVADAITSRKSIRRFLDDPVPQKLAEYWCPKRHQYSALASVCPCRWGQGGAVDGNREGV